ncbi:hypothetical protein OIO90_002510 [Microbotryomycetes sp. JL221]|nr:hypothetical protein OIO90_002510 [Microbotryomycetes sp. JL221]
MRWKRPPDRPVRRPASFVTIFVLVLAVLVCTVEAGPFYSSERKRELRELARETWYHAYKSYHRIAFPHDEVKPLSCRAQGHDRKNPGNAEVNDVMGDYCLTLVDSLDTFAILDDRSGFEQAIRETIQHVSFDRDSRVQVFEVTIRMLGGLLSGHLLATDPTKGYALPWYSGQLLTLATDLGNRLLPAFNTPTGIPYARIHLQKGVRKGDTLETCSAGAASLLLEFAALSRLTNDPRYEAAAKKAFFAIWNRKSAINLVGNTLSAFDGRWMHGISTTGAGIDSTFEYAAKAFVLLGEDEYLRVWKDMYQSILRYIRSPDGFWYRGVNMFTGQLASVFVDSLSAFFPAVQTLVGDLDSAIKAHAVYAFQWMRYSGLPEIFDIHKKQGASLGYPLRPEFIESNLYLYQATKDDWYLEIAERALHDINNRTRTECGFAAIHDLNSGRLEDKQPSFVTAETLKYLFLTFDEYNIFNKDDGPMVYTTEGHMLDLTTPASRNSSSSTGFNVRERKPTLPNPTTADQDLTTCQAYDPTMSDHHQHFLSTGIGTRTDIEWARHLVDLEIYDEVKEIDEGRWFESGFCEIVKSEEYGIELLFAADASMEVNKPGRDQLRQEKDGSVIVGGIQGLRFALTRAETGSDGFIVSRVGPFKVPAGSYVSIHDPLVLANLPNRRVERVQIDVKVVDGKDKSTNAHAREQNDQKQKPFVALKNSPALHASALVANFGPSIASSQPPPNSFAFTMPSLPLVKPTFQFGCDPFVSEEDDDGKNNSGVMPSQSTQVTQSTYASSVEGKVVLLHRGQCSFARKSNMAALSGIKGVIVINSSDDEEFIPSADGDEQALDALVPLLMVSNTTGYAIESMVENAREQGLETSVGLVDAHDETDGGLILGGYQVLNVKLHRK